MNAPATIFANPKQTVLLCLQTTDGYGSLADGYQSPRVDFIRLPSGILASGYPAIMTKLSLGIWYLSFTIPAGRAAIGSYLAKASWPHPTTAVFQSQLFLINVALPFGNSTFSAV